MANLSSTISIEVDVNYLAHQSIPEKEHFLFAYTITITNNGEVPAKLLTRHWNITNGNGDVSSVSGPGVVGKQPHLSSGEHFTYTSSAVLETAVGSMHGHYSFQTENGNVFDVDIPAFRLASPNALH
ncbi:Co2+/Mg2+ efflux protein ApaG [Echinimonas agarilytica]|uniref:Protein ApaG n=1 Tax=Echinimonas agarilytica TaxID=1215918 RepID=A0AA42BAA8_9GAMM|nr:Co2+/Mg2+ efflux protein ApaG [Echinimonas agarilytica]